MRASVVLVIAVLLAPAVPAAQLALPLPSDCGSGQDAGQGGGAMPLAFPFDCEGSFGPRDHGDDFILSIEEPSHLVISWTHEGTSRTRSLCLKGVRCADSMSFYADAGTYVLALHVGLAIGHPEPVRDTYRVVGELRPLAAQDDCGSGRDAETAYPAVPYQEPCYLSRGGPDERDTVRFDVPAGVGRLGGHFLPQGHNACLAPVGVGGCSNTRVGFASAPAPGEWRAWGSPSGDSQLVLWTLPPPAQDDCGSGGDAYDVLLTPGVACAATVDATWGDFEDRFVADLPLGTTITATASEPRLTLCWVTPAAVELACGRGALEMGSAGEPLFLYVRVIQPWELNRLPPAYTITLATRSSSGVAQDDCGSGGDARPDAPAVLPMGSACSGAVRKLDGDHEDVVRFELHAGRPVTLRSDRPFCAVAADGHARHCLESSYDDSNGLNFAPDIDGPWWVTFSSSTWSLELQPGPAQDDCGSGRDAPGAHAYAIPYFPACAGTVDRATEDVDDWYAIEARAGESIVASLAAFPFVQVRVCLHPPAAPGGLACVDANKAPLSHVADVDGAWRLQVSRWGTAQSYRLHAAVVPATG